MQITNVTIITHFINEEKEYGAHSADVNGKKCVFVENEGEIGIISHWVGSRVIKCIDFATPLTSYAIKEAVENC